MDKLLDILVESYSWLIDAYMINYFIDDLWNKLPNSWQDLLGNAEPEDCVCLVDASVPPSRLLPLSILCIRALVKRLPPREEVKSLEDVANKCGIRNVSHGCFRAIASARNIRTKLKPKKQHEIDRVVATVELLRRNNGVSTFNTVIDIGAGMGHLTRILSIYLAECEIISVEQNDKLIDRSVILNERLQRVCGDYATPKHYRESVHDGVSDSVLNCLKKGQKAIITGLHACGDLSASILRIFVSSPEITAVILFGCCYHKLTTTEELEAASANACFPLSSKYQRKRLSHAARDLACHGNEIFAEQLLKKPHIAYQMQCYRAVLESLMACTTNEVVRELRSSIVVRSVACKDGMTFEHYMRSALLKYPEVVEILQEEVSKSESALELVKSVDKEWRRLLMVHCLRLLLAPFVEQIIIRDRAQYLNEHGHSATVVPLFNPKISPRNFAIIAVKM